MIKRIKKYTKAPFYVDEGPRRDLIINDLSNIPEGLVREDDFGNVIFTKGKSSSLLISSHMDTVWENKKDYSFKSKNTKSGVEFEGTLDNSVGDAINVGLAQKAPVDSGTTFLFTVDEEKECGMGLGAGAKNYIDRRYDSPKMAIALDVTYPGKGKGVYAENFSNRFARKIASCEQEIHDLDIEIRNLKTEDEATIFGYETNAFSIGPVLEEEMHGISKCKLEDVEKTEEYLDRFIKDWEIYENLEDSIKFKKTALLGLPNVAVAGIFGALAVNSYLDGDMGLTAARCGLVGFNGITGLYNSKDGIPITKNSIKNFVKKTNEIRENSPYYPFVKEAIEKTENKKLLVKVLTDDYYKKWAEPEILSIYDIEKKKTEKISEFDPIKESKKMERYVLRNNPGILGGKDPKNIFHEIRKNGLLKGKKIDDNKHKEALEIIYNNIDPSAGEREMNRIEDLIYLLEEPEDQYMIANYFSNTKKIVAKKWDRDPRKDMGLDEELYCCTMPQQGPEYITDPNVEMIDFHRNNKRMLRAVAAKAKYKGKDCIVIDSFEGSHDTLDDKDGVNDYSVGEYVAETVKKWAKKEGAEYIIYNNDNYSRMSREMRYHFNGDSKDKIKVKHKRRVSVLKNRYYLESFKESYSPLELFKGVVMMPKNYKMNGKIIEL